MSYSFNARAGSKADLKAAVSDKLDGVVQQQEVHKADRDLAEKAATSAIDLLGELPETDGDEPTHDYSCSVSGSIGQQDDQVTNVNVSIYAAVLAKPTE